MIPKETSQQSFAIDSIYFCISNVTHIQTNQNVTELVHEFTETNRF